MGSLSAAHWLLVLVMLPVVLLPTIVLPIAATVKAFRVRKAGPPSPGWFVFSALWVGGVAISNAGLALNGTGPNLPSVLILAYAVWLVLLWREANAIARARQAKTASEPARN